MDQNGKWQSAGIDILRQIATYGFNIISAFDTSPTHRFRLVARPQNLGNYAESYSSDFFITSSGSFSLTSATDPNATSTLTGFNIKLLQANFTFKVTDPTNNAATVTDGWIHLCQDSGNGVIDNNNCIQSNVSFDNTTGIGQTIIASGNWLVEFFPGNNEQAAAKIYAIAVNNAGVISTIHDISAATGVNLTTPTGNDPWIISLATPNITGQILDPFGNPISLKPNNNQGVDINLQEIDQNGNWQYVGVDIWREKAPYAIAVNSSYDITHTHHFRLVARPQNLDSYVESVSSDFYLTNSGALSLTSATDASATSTLTGLDITLVQANFTFKVIDPTNNGAVVTNGWIHLCQDIGNGSGNPGHCTGINTESTTGIGQTYIGPGNWFAVTEPGINRTGASKIYTITVDGGGVISSIHDLSAATGVNLTPPTRNDPWVISLATPNISGQILDASGNAMTFTQVGNQGIDLFLQEIDSNGVWQYVAAGSWLQRATYGFSIYAAVDKTHTNRYRLVAYPQNLGNYGESFSSEFYLTSSGDLSLTSVTDPSATSTLTGLNIALAVLNPPAFTLSSSSTIARAGIAFYGPKINSTGGTIAEYALTPALPTGLTFDSTTGVISGIATVSSTTATYSISAKNKSGRASADFAITVLPSCTQSSNCSVGDVITNIPVGDSGCGSSTHFSPDGKTAFVINGGAGTITLINVADSSIKATYSFPGTCPDQGFYATKDGQFFYFTDWATHLLYKVRVSTGVVDKTITVGSSPDGLATSDGRYLWVASLGGNTVVKVDTTNDSVVDTITVGSGPYGITLSSNKHLRFHNRT